MVISELIVQDILNLWRDTPLSAADFPAWYLRNKKFAGKITQKQVRDVLKHTFEYLKQSEFKSGSRGRSETLSFYEYARGGLLFLDSAYFLRGYRGGPYYVTGIFCFVY